MQEVQALAEPMRQMKIVFAARLQAGSLKLVQPGVLDA